MATFTKQFALLGETRRHGVRHAPQQQDAVGTHGAGRGDRRDVDRRHDVADPRVRHVAAQLDQLPRPEHDLRAAFWRPQFFVRGVVHGADAAAADHHRRHARDRAAGDHDRHGRHLDRRRRSADRRASSACSTGASGRGRRRSWAPPSNTSRSISPRCTPAGRSPSRKWRAAATWPSSATGRTRRCSLHRGIDPIGKQIRIGGVEYTVLGVVGKRPSPGGAISLGQDDFAIIPYTAFRKQFGSEKVRRGPFGGIMAMVPVLPRKACRARRRCARSRRSCAFATA